MKLTSNWRTYKLQEVTHESQTRALTNERNLSVFGVSNQIGLTTTTRYHAENLERYKVIKPGMFAYNPMRLNIGSIGYCTKDIGSGLVSPDYVVFSCNEELLASEYLYYYIQTHHWKHWMSKAGSGSVRVRIYYKDIETYPIVLPPLAEQSKIIKILNTWENAITLTEQLLIAKQTMRDGIVQKIFTGENRFSEYSGEWKREKLPTVVYFQEGPGLRKWQFRETGVPFLNIRCIQDGKLNLEKAQFIEAEEANTKYEHFLLRPGDFVVSSSATLGKVGVVRKNDLPVMLNTSIIRFRSLDEEKCHAMYLFHFLHSEYFYAQVLKESQGSAQPNFGPSHLKKVNILLPSLEEQRKIAKFLSDVDIEIDLLIRKLELFKQQKKGLMQKLFSGQIRVKV